MRDPHPPHSPRLETVCENFSKYVPGWVVNHLEDNGSLIEGTAEVCGSAINMDIAGFTSLTETLSQQGGTSQGAELIGRVLNIFFDKVLYIISSHNGDVVQFGGDAMLVVFTGPTHQTSSYKCASEICATLSSHRMSVGKANITVTFRIGIGSGEVQRILISSRKDKWTAVTCGTACSNAVSSCDIGTAGKVEVHQGMAEVIANMHGESSPAVVFPVTPKRRNTRKWDAEFKRFVYKGLTTKVNRGEVRNVVVMFVNIGTDDAKSLIEAGHTLERCVQKHGGSCNKLIKDDKGTIALVCFGLPLSTHPENADRACNCASELVRAMECRVVIGIAKDRVFCGAVGNSFRAEYTVLGDAVNLASRLMAHGLRTETESSIVVNETIMNEAQKVPIHQRSSITVKGKIGQVHIGFIDLDAAVSDETDTMSFTPSIRSSSTKSTYSVGSFHSQGSGNWRNIRCGVRLLAEVRSLATRSASTVHSVQASRCKSGSHDNIIGREGIKQKFREFKAAALLLSDLSVPTLPGSSSDLRAESIESEGSSTNILLLRGGPGMGKTSMMHYFMDNLPTDRYAPIRLNPRQMMKGTANGGVLHLIRRIGVDQADREWCHPEIDNSNFPDTVKKALKAPAKVGEGLFEISQALLPTVLSFILNIFATKMHAKQRAVVLLVDDINLMDNNSGPALFRAVADSADKDMRVSMICTDGHKNNVSGFLVDDVDVYELVSSSGSNSSDSFRVPANIPINTMELVPLTREESTLLCEVCLSANQVESSLVDVLVRYCDGSPAITVQALEVLLKEGVIALSSEKVAEILVHDYNFQSLLSNLQTVETSAMGTLDKLTAYLEGAPREILDVAAVIGKPFTLELLEACCNYRYGKDELKAGVGTLVKNGTVIRCDDENYYAFASRALAVTQYNTMLASQKTELHLQIGQAMENIWESLDNCFKKSDLAHHFEEGDFAASASEWHSLSAAEAYRKREFQTAFTHYEKCIKLSAGDDIDTGSNESMEEGVASPHSSIYGVAIRKKAYLAPPAEVAVWLWRTVELLVMAGEYRQAYQRFSRHPQNKLGDIKKYTRRKNGCLCIKSSIIIPPPHPSDKLRATPEEVAAVKSIMHMALITSKWDLFRATGIRLVQFQNERTRMSKKTSKPIEYEVTINDRGITSLIDFFDGSPSDTKINDISKADLTTLFLLVYADPCQSITILKKMFSDSSDMLISIAQPALLASAMVTMGKQEATEVLKMAVHSAYRSSSTSNYKYFQCSIYQLFYDSLFADKKYVKQNSSRSQIFELISESSYAMDDPSLKSVYLLSLARYDTADKACSALKSIQSTSPEVWLSPVMSPPLFHYLWLVIVLHKLGSISNKEALNTLNWLQPLYSRTPSALCTTAMELCVTFRKYISKRSVDKKRLLNLKKTALPLGKYYILSSLVLWTGSGTDQRKKVIDQYGYSETLTPTCWSKRDPL
eukprot:TRINITY_DN7589_c0_g1_i1.p1 TRINITY_DN7589_c0_g1~~TRINITY_DN7589_c0_g1_i1.p1  ORF type:complete len:1454 (+),score=272.00 TRINITY_DN7589_c0_g1_i1:28-4389(+)